MKADGELRGALTRLHEVLTAITGLEGAEVSVEEQPVFLAGVDTGMRIAGKALSDVLGQIESI